MSRNPGRSTGFTERARIRSIAKALFLCAVILIGLTASTAGVTGAQPASTTAEDRLEPNDSRDTATPVEAGDSFEDLAINESDEDYFAIELDEGDEITVELFFSHDEADLDVELEGPDGEVLTGSYSVSDDETIEYTVGESGTYYVRVYPFTGTAPYDIQFSTGAGEQTEVEPDELEPNDERETATAVSSGDDFEDLSITEGDDDYFAIELEAGDQLTTEMFFSHAEADLDVELQGPDGEVLTGSYSVSDDERIEYTVVESGTYYVHVYPFDGTAPYDIEFSVGESDVQPDEFEPNDRLTSSTQVSHGDVFENLSIHSGDVDMFRIDVEEGQTLTAEALFSHSDADIDMQLINADEEELESSTSTTDDELIEYTATEDTVYYVIVYSISGTAGYELSFSLDPPLTPTPTATPTPTPTPTPTQTSLPTASPTQTPTDTPAQTDEPDPEEDAEDEDDDSDESFGFGPGFGPVAVLIALTLVALYGRRRS